MSKIKLHVSNRMEILLEQLSHMLEADPLPAMEPETIIVQSLGMERWLKINLANHHTVAMNYRFPFPNAVFLEFAESYLGKDSNNRLFEPGNLTWKIYAALKDRVDEILKPLTLYIGVPDDPLRRFQISERIAHVFDQYLVFRPDYIRSWERGKSHEGWQSYLWLELVERCGELRHKGVQLEKLVKTLNQNPESRPNLPKRISVFGISSLPPFHLDFLDAVAETTAVHFFLLNPCREYWGDIRSPRAQRRDTRKHPPATCPADRHMETGNRLLASLGEQNRDFIDMMIERIDNLEFERFEAPETRHLLGIIQHDILNLTDRDTRAQTPETGRINSDDHSIQIHSCHGHMREIEVLYDQLLGLMDDDPDLTPKDIIVMCPSIDEYFPYIDAIFANDPAERPPLPYTIADRGLRRQARSISTFFDILELPTTNLSASCVMSILDLDMVQKKFALAENDVQLINRWVSRTNIRWGRSSDDPRFQFNTWRFGIERLLMGYAMAGDGESLVNGVLPFSEIDDSRSDLLAKFLEFTEALFGYVEVLSGSHRLDRWGEIVQELIDGLMVFENDQSAERIHLQRACSALIDRQSFTEIDEKLPLSVIRIVLEDLIGEQRTATGFMAGGVSFCDLIPMRNIPFRVVCLIGMNDDSYPRNEHRLDFDLVNRHRRRGDRSRRVDDRQIYLDSLLSARDCFYISYIGQNIKDNSHLPPSVVVNELVDYIRGNFTINETESVNGSPPATAPEYPIIRHPLHPFDETYFTGKINQKFSYSRENYAAACNLPGEPSGPEPLLTKKLAAADPNARTIMIDDLCRFFENPSAYFLRRRLNIDLRNNDIRLVDREPFGVEGLEKFQVRRLVVKTLLTGGQDNELFEVFRASGILPHAAIGEIYYKKIRESANHLADTGLSYLNQAELAPLAIRFAHGDFVIRGEIDWIYPDCLVRIEPARYRCKYGINVWIQHLLMNICRPRGYPLTSKLLYIADDFTETMTLNPVSRAHEYIDDLLTVYWEGLCRPIPFFPASSWSFMEKLASGSPLEAAKKAALAHWSPDDDYNDGIYRKADGDDSYIERCFRHRDPIDDEFVEYSKRILGPLLENSIVETNVLRS